MGRRSLVRREAVIADTWSAIDAASNVALGNFVTTTTSSPHSQATPSNNIVAAVLLTGKQAGYFRVDCDVGYSDDTNADAVTWTLVGRYVNVAGEQWTVGGAGKQAVGFSGTTSGGGVAAFIDGTGNGTGLTLAAPAGGVSVAQNLDAKTIDSVTGLLAHSDQYYGFHGIVGFAIRGSYTPIVDQQIAFYLEVSAAHTVTIPSLQISVAEIPWQ